jgi:hypothetical protein
MKTKQKLHCERGVAAGRARQRHGRARDPLAQRLRDERRGSELHQLLLAALQRAFALVQVRHVAAAVSDHLHLDVARRRDQLLDVDLAPPERGPRLRLRRGVGARQCLGRFDDAQSAAAASGQRLDHHLGAGAQRRHEFARLVQRHGPRQAARHRHVVVLRELPRAGLVAQKVEHLRTGPDEDEARFGAAARQLRVLAQEAVAGMHGIAAGAARRLDDGIDVEVGGGAGPGQRHGLVGAPPVQRAAIVHGVHRHAVHAKLGGGPRDAHGDLAAVGDQHFAKRRRQRGRRVDGWRGHGIHLLVR